MTRIDIRCARDSDRAFITDTIRHTMSHCSAYAQGLHPEALNFVMDSVLATYTTLIATPDSTGDDILGYLVHDGEAKVGFVYVKQAIRRHGIANALLEHAGIRKGEVITPLLVTKLAGVGNFPRAAQEHGYVIRFRPWEALQITAQLVSGDGYKRETK